MIKVNTTTEFDSSIIKTCNSIGHLNWTINMIPKEDESKLGDYEVFKDSKRIEFQVYDTDTNIVYDNVSSKLADIVREIKTLSEPSDDTLVAVNVTINDCVPSKQWITIYTINSIIHGVESGSYSFTKYKSKTKVKFDTLYLKQIVSTCNIVLGDSIDKFINLSKCRSNTRDLINGNASEITPEFLMNYAVKIKKENKKTIKATIFNGEQLSKEFPLVKAVGQSSQYKPQVIVLEYIGDKLSKDMNYLIGKGVTYDTGGYSLKPSNSMDTMKTDMSGAATSLSVIEALSLNKVKTNLTVIVPAVVNGIGSNAIFPGDVVKSRSGNFVEINNTDAEGRLIIADCLTYAQDIAKIKKYTVTSIIDIATLTGAAVVALGDKFAPIFSNSSELISKVKDCKSTSVNPVWEMPYKEYMKDIHSKIADVKNVGLPGSAGSSSAAAFLKYFVDDEYSWMHIDIAGVAYNKGSASGIVNEMATGFGLDLLYEFYINQ